MPPPAPLPFGARLAAGGAARSLNLLLLTERAESVRLPRDLPAPAQLPDLRTGESRARRSPGMTCSPTPGSVPRSGATRNPWWSPPVRRPRSRHPSVPEPSCRTAVRSPGKEPVADSAPPTRREAAAGDDRTGGARRRGDSGRLVGGSDDRGAAPAWSAEAKRSPGPGASHAIHDAVGACRMRVPDEGGPVNSAVDDAGQARRRQPARTLARRHFRSVSGRNRRDSELQDLAERSPAPSRRTRGRSARVNQTPRPPRSNRPSRLPPLPKSGTFSLPKSGTFSVLAYSALSPPVRNIRVRTKPECHVPCPGGPDGLGVAGPRRPLRVRASPFPSRPASVASGFRRVVASGQVPALPLRRVLRGRRPVARRSAAHPSRPGRAGRKETPDDRSCSRPPEERRMVG